MLHFQIKIILEDYFYIEYFLSTSLINTIYNFSLVNKFIEDRCKIGHIIFYAYKALLSEYNIIFSKKLNTIIENHLENNLDY